MLRHEQQPLWHRFEHLDLALGNRFGQLILRGLGALDIDLFVEVGAISATRATCDAAAGIVRLIALAVGRTDYTETLGVVLPVGWHLVATLEVHEDLFVVDVLDLEVRRDAFASPMAKAVVYEESRALL